MKNIKLVYAPLGMVVKLTVSLNKYAAYTQDEYRALIWIHDEYQKILTN